MEMPEYISKEEVKNVCRELKFRDWTKLKIAKVLPKEAKVILAEVNAEKMRIDLEEFRKGMEVELEHGIRFKDANVTNNHPILTGMIVIAHLKESLDYYGAPRAKPVVPPCSSAESAEAYPPTRKASEGYPLRIHPRP